MTWWLGATSLNMTAQLASRNGVAINGLPYFPLLNGVFQLSRPVRSGRCPSLTRVRTRDASRQWTPDPPFLERVLAIRCMEHSTPSGLGELDRTLTQRSSTCPYPTSVSRLRTASPG